MGKLLLVRHGKSFWDIADMFTGWTDIDLAPEGMLEARNTGALIKSQQITIDCCFTSYLKRAIRTAQIILDTTDQMQVDVIKSWKLNERHYGAWQGRKKGEVKEEVGEELFELIQRGYSTPPPSLSLDDERHPKFDPRYAKLPPALLPVGESLEQTKLRTVHYFYKAIVPALVDGKTVLLTAHENSIRALMGHIEQIPPAEIPTVSIASGVLLMYTFDRSMNLKERYTYTKDCQVLL